MSHIVRSVNRTRAVVSAVCDYSQLTTFYSSKTRYSSPSTRDRHRRSCPAQGACCSPYDELSSSYIDMDDSPPPCKNHDMSSPKEYDLKNGSPPTGLPRQHQPGAAVAPGSRESFVGGRIPRTNASHSSLSSVESTEIIQLSSVNASNGHSARWSALETLGRFMFVFSVAFFVAGILITVFGFTNTGLSPGQQLPMQIIGPVCLVSTLVTWILGCVFSHLWKTEWKRQRQAMELRTRVQLHAMAMDMLKRPTAGVLSPRLLADPRLRRQLLMKLRQQQALDVSSNDNSRRSSRAASLESRRRKSSVMSAFLRQGGGHSSRKSSLAHSGKILLPPAFDLPGIHISRIETMDFDDRSIYSGSGSGGAGSGCESGRKKKSKKYIIVHSSDAGSDLSRLSFPSEYSLSGSRSSRSSRSRSSRDSSNVSSRLWDFSPRESDWDVTGSISRQDIHGNVYDSGGGGLVGGGRDYSLLSPTIPRKGSVVTFDISEPTVRRHSSPAPSLRRRDSECACASGNGSSKNDYPSALKSSSKDHRQPYSSLVDNVRLPHVESGDNVRYMYNGSGDSVRGDNVRYSPHIGENNEYRSSSRKKNSCDQSLISITIDEERSSPSYRESRSSHRRASVVDQSEQAKLRQQQQQQSISDSGGFRNSRPPVRRTSTDESEVEKRRKRIVQDLKHSLTDSLDEAAKASNGYQQHQQQPHHPDVIIQTAEAETQTSSEPETPNVKSRNFSSGGSNFLSSSGRGSLVGDELSTSLNSQPQQGSGNKWRPLETINVASTSDNEDLNSSDNEDITSRNLQTPISRTPRSERSLSIGDRTSKLLPTSLFSSLRGSKSSVQEASAAGATEALLGDNQRDSSCSNEGSKNIRKQGKAGEGSKARGILMLLGLGD